MKSGESQARRMWCAYSRRWPARAMSRITAPASCATSALRRRKKPEARRGHLGIAATWRRAAPEAVRITTHGEGNGKNDIEIGNRHRREHLRSARCMLRPCSPCAACRLSRSCASALTIEAGWRWLPAKSSNRQRLARAAMAACLGGDRGAAAGEAGAQCAYKLSPGKCRIFRSYVS